MADKISSLLDKFVSKDKLSELTIKNPRQAFNDILKQVSGASTTRNTTYQIFYQIVAFKGVVDGVGTSTIVANTALALAELGVSVCVVDTSILYPVQDLLLKTDYKDRKKEDRIDWFDMPYTSSSPLHISKLNNKISVLSFAGKDRGITDILSTNDNAALVDIAFTALHNKFDLILVDSCSEMTTVNATAVQMSQQVIQVWNDSPTVVNSIDNFITNQGVLACALDKMRYVIFSKITSEVMGNLNELLAQYRLRKLAETEFSKSIYDIICIGKPLWQHLSKDQDVINYTDSIIEIALHLLNEDRKKKGGTITSNDIMEGKVNGTVHKKMKEQAEGMPVIATDMATATAQLQTWNNQATAPMQGMPNPMSDAAAANLGGSAIMNNLQGSMIPNSMSGMSQVQPMNQVQQVQPMNQIPNTQGDVSQMQGNQAVSPQAYNVPQTNNVPQMSTDAPQMNTSAPQMNTGVHNTVVVNGQTIDINGLNNPNFISSGGMLMSPQQAAAMNNNSK